MEYLKVKIEELETNSKIKNIWDLYRGSNDFKKGYQPRTNMVKYEKGDLVTDFHRILNRWRNHFSTLLNVHGVNDVRWKEIHTAQPLMPDPSAFHFEMAIEKLKQHKSPGTDQIPVERLKQGVEQFALRSINLLILFGIRRNCLINEIMVIIEAYHFCQLCTKLYPTPCCHG